jgi:hypothetical protein
MRGVGADSDPVAQNKPASPYFTVALTLVKNRILFAAFAREFPSTMQVLRLFSAYFLTLTSIGAVSSLPLNNDVAFHQHIQSSIDAHPALASYQYVEGQLQVVITEIKAFNSVNPRTETFYRHAMETIESLRKANDEIINGPDFGFFGWAGFSPTLASLWIKIHELSWAIQDKKNDITATKTDLVFYTLLKQAHEESERMKQAFQKKLPGYMATLTKPIISEAIGKLREVRDMFKPKEGDLDVVIVTTPYENVQPQQWQGSSPPWQQSGSSPQVPQQAPSTVHQPPPSQQNQGTPYSPIAYQQRPNPRPQPIPSSSDDDER